MPRRASLAGLALAILLTTASAYAEEAPPEPVGYRLDEYLAPTPATINGRPALTAAETRKIWSDKSAVFIDVLPHPPRPAGLPADMIWRDKAHPSISGAQWLPEVGRGELAPETEAYFNRSLAELTGGDKARALAFFCKRACWMSWNAAKRAESYGYSSVYWFPDGIEGWREIDGPTETIAPRP